jgi:hypothetical protein
MPAGRPRTFRPEELKPFADIFYSDFRRLAEGRTRQRVDRSRFDQVMRDLDTVQLSHEETLSIAESIDGGIRAGRIPSAEREDRIRDAQEGHLWTKRHSLYDRAVEEATKTLKVPGEPDVLDALLRASTAKEIREICRSAFRMIRLEVEPGDYRDVRVTDWPISGGSMLPEYLSRHADQFITAKNDRRFPGSTDRPTSRLKQLWFLSRALAGALFGIKTRTAINLIGSLRPEQAFEELHAGKPARKGKER